jgi:hypothetical protein
VRVSLVRHGLLLRARLLDWLNSGVVSGLFAGGGLLVLAFIATELTVEHPLIRLRVVAGRRNVWLSAVLISIYGFGG